MTQIRTLGPDEKITEPGAYRMLLRYEADSGHLFWLPRSPDMFEARQRTREHRCNQWNSCWAGKRAFTSIDANGYHHGNIFCKTHYAHRVIWALVTGGWPSNEIDHINGDRSDNRWENLRAASHYKNMQNQRLSAANKSGLKGVCWDKKNRRWMAQIGADGRNIFLGYFDTPAAGHAAYAKASAELHGNFGRLA